MSNLTIPPHICRLTANPGFCLTPHSKAKACDSWTIGGLELKLRFRNPLAPDSRGSP
jgi:hypothetical protein